LKENIRGARSATDARHAGEPVREEQITGPRARQVDGGLAVGQLERRLERIGQPVSGLGLQNEPVHDDLDGVRLLPVELDPAGDLLHLAVDTRAHEALAHHLEKHLAVLPLATANDGRQDLRPGAAWKLEHLVDDLLHGLARDRLVAAVAMGHADAGEQQPHVVVDLGHRPDRRARVA
jgi:hypothetical protein